LIDHLAHLRADCDAVLAVLDRTAGDEPVAACPGWGIRELVEHLGGVHRWATQIVQTGARVDQTPTPGGRDLTEWFAEGADELLRTLAAADPTADAWSFTADRTAGFWRRRQALETVVHRWDAQRAAGEPERIDPVLAADGLHEVADLMLPRQVRLGRVEPLSRAVRLTATDASGDVLLGEGEPAATVAGPAELLLLLLWHRVQPTDPRLQVDGDAATADHVLRQALAP
jgi:uncharacterized protein (TIGR03083 family)